VLAFILRPFGVKGGIDFDRVEAELVRPALAALDISGRTSVSMIQAGSIREDLFTSLLTSDLVLADISFPSADLFYELGLAHALRDKRTFLLKAARHDVPFDLRTDRYLAYDESAPGNSIQALVSALRATIQSERVDSPVYALLPGLNRPRATTVPASFVSETERAKKARDLGHLRLLSQEARSFHWAVEGLKKVGDAQFYARDMRGAMDTFEYMLSIQPDDTDVNLRLGTVYQRLRQPRESDRAIKRALDILAPGSKDRAEALALLGRNAKGEWLDAWRSRPQAQWREEALRCSGLREAYDYYLKAFKADLNNYYAGLNALAMGTIAVDLATGLPEVWEELFEDDSEAASRLSTLKQGTASLASSVEMAVEAAEERQGDSDLWLQISRADLTLLTSKRPGRVADWYRRALVDTPPFVTDSALTQVYIFRDLGVLKDNAEAAVAGLGSSGPAAPLVVSGPATRALLFVGHAIDAPDRAAPRFPAAAEPLAREAILRAIQAESGEARTAFVGVAGASSGGDILFHEACEASGIAVRICLALPATEYSDVGVASAGPQWQARFHALLARHPHQVLSELPELPAWLRPNARYDFWGRDTLWRYHTAVAVGDITVIALWDGKGGAAADLVHMAKERGAKVVVLDAARLLAGAEATPGG
jgi:hypothetical protein